LVTTDAATWPTSTVQLLIGNDRKRSITPCSMSLATETAVLAARNPAQSTITPGTT
jgi:hypothetical protein